MLKIEENVAIIYRKYIFEVFSISTPAKSRLRSRKKIIKQRVKCLSSGWTRWLSFHSLLKMSFDLPLVICSWQP